MGRVAFGWALVGTALAAVFAVVVRKRDRVHRDFLLSDEQQRRRARSTARYYNDVGDSAGF